VLFDYSMGLSEIVSLKDTWSVTIILNVNMTVPRTTFVKMTRTVSLTLTVTAILTMSDSDSANIYLTLTPKVTV